jgi:hypothetical protein
MWLTVGISILGSMEYLDDPITYGRIMKLIGYTSQNPVRIVRFPAEIPTEHFKYDGSLPMFYRHLLPLSYSQMCPPPRV